MTPEAVLKMVFSVKNFYDKLLQNNTNIEKPLMSIDNEYGAYTTIEIYYSILYFDQYTLTFDETTGDLSNIKRTTKQSQNNKWISYQVNPITLEEQEI